MFKILTLNTDVDKQLDTIQQDWEILSVENLGVDTTFNHYLLIQYDTKVDTKPVDPPVPITGSSIAGVPTTLLGKSK